MKKEVAKRWVKALNSGKYEQAESVLHTLDNRFCCLGVLCDVIKAKKLHFETGEGWAYGDEDDSSATLLPRVVRKRTGIQDSSGILQIPRKWAEKHGLMEYGNESVIVQFDGKYVSVDLASLNDEGAPFNLIAKIIDKFWKEM